MDAWLRQASPLVVIGMHRSGTRLLAQILDRLGIFMGADLQADSESVTFMQINEWILHQCGAFWSEPMSAHFILSQPDSVQQIAAGTLDALKTQIQNYAGESGWHLGASREEMRPFGWKDPRNTFTLPVWRQIFPNLRSINVMRHGVDVAASLSRRHSTALAAATGESVPAALTVIKDHALGVLSSRRGWTLEEALTMWEQYAEKGRLQSADLGDRALDVRFEDLLSQPDKVMLKIAQFCGVSAPEEGAFNRELIQAGRAFAFRKDAKLAVFADTVRENLRRYGYTP
jgi:hypothetical protein